VTVLWDQYEIWVVGWCFFALLFGGLLKGALGVGTPLLTVPLMAFVLPAQTAVAMMAIPVVVANVWQARRATDGVSVIKRLWPAFIAVLIGTWVGVQILVGIDNGLLLIMVGVLVIMFAIIQGSQYQLTLPKGMQKAAGAGFGLAAGLIGGLSSMFGPMLIVYLTAVPGFSKEKFVSSISFLYVSAVVPWTVILIWFGVLDRDRLILSSFAVLPVSLGILIGERLRHLISESHFRIMVLVVLLCSGTTMLWRGLS
jgi:uncharacterized protein